MPNEICKLEFQIKHFFLHTGVLPVSRQKKYILYNVADGTIYMKTLSFAL